MRKLYTILILIFGFSCIYNAGNVGCIISFPSNIRSKLIMELTDSLHSYGELVCPENFKNVHNFYGSKHLEHKLYYFSNDPEEVYYVTIDVDISIRYIYSFDKNEVISRETNLNEEEYNRIRTRFIKEVLGKIDLLANELGYKKEDIYIDTILKGNVVRSN